MTCILRLQWLTNKEVTYRCTTSGMGAGADPQLSGATLETSSPTTTRDTAYDGRDPGWEPMPPLSTKNTAASAGQYHYA